MDLIVGFALTAAGFCWLELDLDKLRTKLRALEAEGKTLRMRIAGLEDFQKRPITRTVIVGDSVVPERVRAAVQKGMREFDPVKERRKMREAERGSFTAPVETVVEPVTTSAPSCDYSPSDSGSSGGD